MEFVCALYLADTMPENQMVRMGGQVDLSQLNPNLRVSDMHLRRSGSLDLIAPSAAPGTAPLQLHANVQQVNNHRESPHHPAARYSMYAGPAPAMGAGGDSDVEIIEVGDGRLMGIGGVPVARVQTQAPPLTAARGVAAAGRGEFPLQMQVQTASAAGRVPDDMPLESEEDMAYRLMKMRGANESFRNAVDKAFTRQTAGGKSLKSAREPKRKPQAVAEDPAARQPVLGQVQVPALPSMSAAVSTTAVADGASAARGRGRSRDKSANKEQERRAQSQGGTAADKDAGRQRRPSESSFENAANQQPSRASAGVAVTGRLPAPFTDREAGVLALRYVNGLTVFIYQSSYYTSIVFNHSLPVSYIFII